MQVQVPFSPCPRPSRHFCEFCGLAVPSGVRAGVPRGARLPGLVIGSAGRPSLACSVRVLRPRGSCAADVARDFGTAQS